MGCNLWLRAVGHAMRPGSAKWRRGAKGGAAPGGQGEVESLEEGEVRPREAARPAAQQRTSALYTGRQYGQQALGGKASRGQVLPVPPPPPFARGHPVPPFPPRPPTFAILSLHHCRLQGAANLR